MRKALVLVAALLLSLGMFAGTAGAQEGPPPRHGHVLVLHVEYDADGEPVGYGKCIDIANGRALPLTAHHSTIHQGRAGQALAQAGHAAIPTDPLFPGFSGCSDLDQLLEGE